MNIIHSSFNPCLPGSLQRACSEVEGYGYELIRVVPVHMYEMIAVFKNDIAPEGEQLSQGKVNT